MSKKFRLAFKRTLCRCCYTSDELLELNGKSKSVYCSVHSTRQHTNHITKSSYADLKGTQLLSGLFKSEGQRDAPAVSVGNKSTRCTCCNNQGRLNDSYSECEKNCVGGVGNGFGPRAVGLRYQSSLNTSLVSFCDLETDSVVEMKSMSSESSANLLNQKLLTVPLRSIQIKRGSFV